MMGYFGQIVNRRARPQEVVKEYQTSYAYDPPIYGLIQEGQVLPVSSVRTYTLKSFKQIHEVEMG